MGYTNSKNKKVVVAMSGGVDSSCAAYLLKKQGYKPIGISLRLWPKEECGFYRPASCCSLEGIADARLVSEKLKIPFYVLDFHKEFKRDVIDYFSKEYLAARTPNPCILCNEKIKFGTLLRKAKELGAGSVATGHYARVEFDKRKKVYLLKEGLDKSKDQSYALFSLSQDQLSNIKFPLGRLKKNWVRKTMKKMGFLIHAKKDSQEVCFIQDNYREFLKKRFPGQIKPGPVLDLNGKKLGTHQGLPFYTIGQREGLGIPYKYPLYVIKIDKEKNEIFVGPRESKLSKFMELDCVSWISKTPKKTLKASVKIRYQHKKAPATLFSIGKTRIRVEFDQGQESPTPGQAAVFYKKDTVLGGGWIR